MIVTHILSDVTLELLRRSVTSVPDDVEKALKAAYEKESNELGKMHLKTMIDSVELAKKLSVGPCGDTGLPIFYVKLGTAVKIEGGVANLEKVIIDSVMKAIDAVPMRPSAVHPLTRHNPNTNVGDYMPYINYRFALGADYVEITAAPKGFGTEIMGAAYKTLIRHEGLKGVKKFFLNVLAEAGLKKKYCFPVIIGVGLGGTADIAMRLAKEAATLRAVGVRHPDEEVAKLELELLELANMTGIGPMAMGGDITALDVHVEYAYTNFVALPIAISYECMFAKMATARIYSDNRVEYRTRPDWLKR